MPPDLSGTGRVQRLTVLSDKDAQTLAVKVEKNAFFTHHLLKLHIHLHSFENARQETFRFFSSFFLLFRGKRSFLTAAFSFFAVRTSSVSPPAMTFSPAPPQRKRFLPLRLQPRQQPKSCPRQSPQHLPFPILPRRPRQRHLSC